MKLMILDGNSIANRAFFGVRLLNAPDGTPTNMIFGFMNILNRICNEYRPDALCVSFDMHAPTFRHKANENYKAQRRAMPDELRVQMPLLKELLDLLGIKHYEVEGYEADDVIGTVAAICEKQNCECIVVTGDKDSFQLISDKVSIAHIKTKGGQNETVLYTPEVFRSEYGFEPAMMVDLKALMGDSSDNIPGVAGIGEKTAMDLVRRYGTVDSIYADLKNLDIKDGIRKKIEAGESSARESFWLASIFREVPIKFNPEDNIWNEDNYRVGLYQFLYALGLNKIIEKWRVAQGDSVNVKETEGTITLPETDIMDSNGIDFSKLLAIESDSELSFLDICDGEKIYHTNPLCFGYDDILKNVFSAETRKIGHNIKAIKRALFERNMCIEGFVFDTAIAAYLFNPNAQDYPSGGVQNIYNNYPVYKKKLEELGMEKLYYTIELPLCDVLAEMENTGFLVDADALKEFGESLSGNINALQTAIWAHAGDEFNISSPKQLGEVLFDRLQLPYGKKTKTGWSTNADVLDKLRGMHPIIEEILEYRELTKLKSTYAEGLLKVISSDGRIHTNFQMTVAATGRLSSTDPNLQNIPIRKQTGSQIRRMFIASPGNVLVDADYSQIELRLLAHISGDEAMIGVFNSGEDFHTLTAARVFNVPFNEVSPELRSRAKAVNFGIVYGISAFSLAQDIGVFTNEAKAYMDAYFDKFSGVHIYMKNIVNQAKKDGFVTTLYGRRRDIPELASSNFNVRSFGERVALNMPIQGTAADIIKLAMVQAYNSLREKCPEARMVLQVHDELIVECPEDKAMLVSDILKSAMESVANLRVPLLAEASFGTNWSEAH